MTGQSSAPIELVRGAWHGSRSWASVTSHSPFLSRPDRVAAAILGA